MTRAILEKEGWKVSEAENGRVALECMERERPSLILLDLMMPEMDGFEFAARVRRNAGWRSIPIVVLTAHDLSSEERRRLNGYVETILQKAGDSREALLHQLRDLLDDYTAPRALTMPEARRKASDFYLRRFSKAMPKILLVEDNEMNRDMLSRRLQRKGYQVVLALDGQSGVEMAQTEAPDLVLMDMSLPVLDGWEATRRLKADAATRHIPVIALTAHAMSSDREKALEAGCDDYDTKPVELPRLLAKIEALLSGGRRWLPPGSQHCDRTAIFRPAKRPGTRCHRA